MTLRFTGLLDAAARGLGYVPASEYAALLASKERLEAELRHKSERLRSQLALRDQLRHEVHFLRDLELARANSESETQQAVARIDNALTEISRAVRAVWPDGAHPGVGSAETEEVSSV